MTRIITTSLLKAFLLCPLEAYYMEQGLQKPQKPGSPLARGSFIHELLDTGTPPDLGPDMFEEERALYDDYIHLVEAYHFNWRNADWRRIKSEFKLHRPIRDGVEYWGKVDELVYADGKIWIVDHKTHVQLPSTAFRLLDIQHSAYIWLLKPWLQKHGMLDGTGKYEFGGFVWDYLLMNKIKEPKLTAAGKFRRVTGGQLPFTDYTTLRRVLLAEGCASAVDGPVATFTDKLPADEQAFISDQLAVLHDTPSPAFLRYFDPYNPDIQQRQEALIMDAIQKFLAFDFDHKPIQRNPLICGNSYLCSCADLAVAELVEGTDAAARRQFTQVDPLSRYNDDTEGD